MLGTTGGIVRRAAGVAALLALGWQAAPTLPAALARLWREPSATCCRSGCCKAGDACCCRPDAEAATGGDPRPASVAPACPGGCNAAVVPAAPATGVPFLLAGTSALGSGSGAVRVVTQAGFIPRGHARDVRVRGPPSASASPT